MEFEINGRKWEIIETNQQKMNEVEKTTEETGYKYFGICCYEVSDDVREKLLNTVSDTVDLTNDRNVDLKHINKRQLEEIGVTKIDVCPYCTSCNNNLFYSYRKEDGTTNRHYAMLML